MSKGSPSEPSVSNSGILIGDSVLLTHLVQLTQFCAGHAFHRVEMAAVESSSTHLTNPMKESFSILQRMEHGY